MIKRIAQRFFLHLVAIVFFMIAIIHSLRIIQRWDITVNGSIVPNWMSGVAVVVALLFGLRSYHLAKE